MSEPQVANSASERRLRSLSLPITRATSCRDESENPGSDPSISGNLEIVRGVVSSESRVPEREDGLASALGLNEEDDAASHRERLARVLHREPVDDLERLLALDGADDAAAELRAAVGVLEVDRRDRDAGVAIEIPRLPASRLREEDDVVALDADPDRHRVRRAVRKRRREMREVARFEELAHLGRKDRHLRP